jgi:hypothetical protein
MQFADASTISRNWAPASSQLRYLPHAEVIGGDFVNRVRCKLCPFEQKVFVAQRTEDKLGLVVRGLRYAVFVLDDVVRMDARLAYL